MTHGSGTHEMGYNAADSAAGRNTTRWHFLPLVRHSASVRKEEGDRDETPMKRKSRQQADSPSPPSSFKLPVFVFLCVHLDCAPPLPQSPLTTVPNGPVATKIKTSKDPSQKVAHGIGGRAGLESLATPKHTPGSPGLS